ncbi:MAG TPA: hypothetical protein PKG90_12775 [Chitinophagaceae bacterium]|nr:hypothetical protein [Chitinophagaceae bacterium]HNU13731.1 hypothetical protein [Chitinophagaceae bacterium]
MKKILFILSLCVFATTSILAQDEGDEKIRDKMREYIQQRMHLNKDEAERFTPVFLRYFKEWRTTLRENRTLPKLDLQQKIIDLRLRYRIEFKEIVGERRSNEIYEHQEKFIRILKDVQKERMQNRQGPRNRIRSLPR